MPHFSMSVKSQPIPIRARATLQKSEPTVRFKSIPPPHLQPAA
jgi:hypothetical protein